MAMYLDIVTLVVAVVFAILGATSGFIRELFRLAGMVAGVFVAFLFYVDFGRFIVAATQGITPVAAAAIMAFLIIFVAVFLAVIGVGFLLRKFTDLITLGWVDRLLGALFGVSKILIVVWAVCLSISTFPAQEAKFQKSVVYSTFKSLPESFKLKSLEAARDVLRGVRSAATPQRDNTPQEPERENVTDTLSGSEQDDMKDFSITL